MRYDTINGRTDRRTYLKAIGAGALATGMAGLAGCLGAEAETRGNSDSRETTDSSDNETTTNADEAQASGSNTTESESINCNDLKSEFAAYDAAGTPLVYTFDYPENWNIAMENPLQWDEELKPQDWDMPQEELEQIEFTTVVIDKSLSLDSYGTSSVVFKAYQSLRPEQSNKDSSKYATDITEVAMENRGVVSYPPADLLETFIELDFNGETITVLRMHDETTANATYIAVLPYATSSGERRYYQMEFQVGEGFEEGFEQCTNIINDLAEQVVQSIRPNPESIIESMPDEME